MSVKLNKLEYITLLIILIKFHFTDLTFGKENIKNLHKNSSNTNQLQSVSSTTTRRPFYQSTRLPCSCYKRQCGCCTGVVLETFNQKTCLNFTYEPDDFSVGTAMTINNRVIYKNTFSGKNPPPFCVRVPRLSFIRLCVTFSNIYFASRNVHLCIDMEANWQDFTILEWSFDCIRMGLSGFAVVPPEEGGDLPSSSVDVEEQTDEDYDDSARNVQFDNVSIENNLKSSSGKFRIKTTNVTTKGMSDMKAIKKSSAKNRIHVPVHAEFTSHGDIKFTLKKVKN